MKDKPHGDDIFEQIVEMIYACELEPGAVINESSLAQKFCVSRGPVREAVRRLQGIQLVSREPYYKARVIELGPHAVLELFQMREALEGMACRLAAERMSAEALAKLSRDLESERHAIIKGRQSQSGPVFDFHEQIVRSSENQRIVQALHSDLYPLLRIYRRRSGAVTERKEAAYSEHWQILRALKSRDGELAESLMRSHVARAGAHVVQNLSQRDSVAKNAARTRKRA